MKNKKHYHEVIKQKLNDHVLSLFYIVSLGNYYLDFTDIWKVGDIHSITMQGHISSSPLIIKEKLKVMKQFLMFYLMECISHH